MSFLICLLVYTVVTYLLLRVPFLQKHKAFVLATTGVLAFLAGRYYPDLNSNRRGFDLDGHFFGFFGAILLVWIPIRFLRPQRWILFCSALALILFCMGFVRLHDHEFFWGQAYIGLRLIWLLSDLRSERVRPAPTFAEYLAFVFYFPSLCVGPIFSYFDFKTQLSAEATVSSVDADDFLRILRGVLKFIVLAPTVHSVATTVIIFGGFLSSPADYMIGFPATYLYLYLAFSGASDIVLPMSRMLGFKLPENFDAPFKSKNISEFWTRWNVSLGYFFRYIIYFPLQKEVISKYPSWRNYATPALLMLIMFLMGLWHGFQISYIAYGLVHGLALVIHFFYVAKLKPLLNKKYPILLDSAAYHRAAWIMTHVFVCLTIPLVMAPYDWLNLSQS